MTSPYASKREGVVYKTKENDKKQKQASVAKIPVILNSILVPIQPRAEVLRVSG